MNNSYDYRRFSILYVDDEAQAVSNFKEYFSDTFEIETATSGEQAWSLFESKPDQFAIVMTDQRMPTSSGVELLERVRASRHRVLRILATAYSDMDAAIAAVNTGAIYKYITKPWDPPTMEMTLKRGMEFFLVQRERDLLMKEKMSALQRLMVTDRLLSLGIFAAGLNHHLRNSLTAVKTFLDLAPFQLQSENVDVNNLRNPDYWRDFYDTAQEQMKKVVELLQEIKEIPEPTGMPLADTVPLNSLVETSIERQRAVFSGRNIAVKVEPGKIPEIQGNRALLEKAMILLFSDEAENVNTSGKVSVRTQASTDAQGKPGVLLEVSDSGPGLTPENLACVFDPFFVRSNHPGKYGLNLLTCFFIVHHHSGTMSVSRSDIGGASFQIFLPVVSREPDVNQEKVFLQRVFELEKAWEKMLLAP